MRSLFLAPLVLPLMLSAAFGQSANLTHDAFARQTDNQRRTSLQASITEQGNACTSVAAAVFGGRDRAGHAYWDARCEEGNSYRVTLPQGVSMQRAVLNCGAHVAGPTGGPCFQTAYSTVVGAAPGSAGGPRVLYGRPEIMLEARCRATCADGPMNGISACTSICLQGGDASAPPMNAAGVDRINAAHDLAIQPAHASSIGGTASRIAINLGVLSACRGSAGVASCQREAATLQR